MNISNFIKGIKTYGAQPEYTNALFSYMQSTPQNTGGECMDTLSQALTTFTAVSYASQQYGDYTDAHVKKGDGPGTYAGFIVSNVSLYMDLSVELFGLYANCNIDYYMMSFSTGFQTISGGTNMIMNIMWRVFIDDQSTMNGIMAGSDPAKIGAETGKFIKALFMVDIPIADDGTSKEYEDASKFVIAI